MNPTATMTKDQAIEYVRIYAELYDLSEEATRSMLKRMIEEAEQKSESDCGCGCGCSDQTATIDAKQFQNIVSEMEFWTDEDEEIFKNCGIGPDGFQEGNSCGAGGGSGSSDSSSSSSSDKPSKPRKPRGSAKPTKGTPPSEGMSAPKEHNADIPSNPKRISIDQAENAFRSMGYQMAAWKPSVSGTTVTLRDSSGKETSLPVSDAVNLIYANSSDPKMNAAPALKPKKSMDHLVSQKTLFAIDGPTPAFMLTKSADDEFEEITDREKELASNLSKELRSRMREVLAEIRRSSAPTQEMVVKLEQIIRSSKFDRRVVEAVRPYLLSAVESGKQIGIDTVSRLMGPTANPDALFRSENRSLAAYAQVEADEAARRMASSFREYTEAKVRSIVAEAMSDGRSIPEIAEALQDWSDEAETYIADSQHRAITIARTEAQRAARRTEVAAWKASGVVVGKTWLLAPDPCEFCEAASNLYSQSDAAIGLDSSFFEKGSILEGADGGNLRLDYEAIDGPPLHPNCRCSLQPRLSDDFEDIVQDAEAEVRKLGPFNPENA